MAFFTWKDSFKIGIDDIDSQHEKFLGYLNECFDNVSVEKQKDISPELVAKLETYAKEHFNFEENIMQFTGYPEIEKHQALHRDFEERIMQLKSSSSEEGSAESARNVLTFLRDWFLNHILEEDRKLVPHI